MKKTTATDLMHAHISQPAGRLVTLCTASARGSLVLDEFFVDSDGNPVPTGKNPKQLFCTACCFAYTDIFMSVNVLAAAARSPQKRAADHRRG